MYSLYFTFEGKNDSNKSISECIFHLQFKMTKFELKNKGIGEKSSSVFQIKSRVVLCNEPIYWLNYWHTYAE